MVLVAKTTHRKYHNARTYHCYKDGELAGIFPLEWKMNDDELKKFLIEIRSLTNADRIVLHWTALEGIVDEEVEI